MGARVLMTAVGVNRVPRRVGVVGGGGTLGRTVVHAALAAGFTVTVVGRPGAERDAARFDAIATALERDVRTGRATPAAHADRLSRLVVTSDYAELRGVGAVVEAVAEDLTAKRAAYDRIEAVVEDDCLIASTTSTIPLRDLAAHARHPERFVVAHYVWPADRIPVVEVATSAATSAEARDRLDELLSYQGKSALHVADRPGFVITRVLFAYWSSAIEFVRHGLSPDVVDRELERFGWPMGPLRVIDATGPESVVRIFSGVAPALDAPLDGLSALAAAVGRGAASFYVRTRGERRVNDLMVAALQSGRRAAAESTARSAAIVDTTMCALAAEIDAAVQHNAVASWADVGAAIDLAYGFPASQGGVEAWWSRRATATSSDVPHCAAVS